MRQWTIPSAGSQHVALILFERFSNQVLANALEPMRAANTFLGRPAYSWDLLTLDGGPVRSSAGMQVVPDGALDDATRGSALILLPSYGYRDADTPELRRRLRRAAKRFDTLVGIDGGSWLLASAGLLDNRRATIHFDEFDTFSEHFPQVDVARERWVDAGDRVTASGAAAVFEMTMHLIARAHGTALTLRIASLFAVPDPVPAEPVEPRTRDRRVRRALTEMETHVEAPLPLPELARRAGCPQKDLERRFHRAFGAPPRKVYQRVRLNAARALVESTRFEISEIAARAGYASAASFTRAFREAFGATPTDLRRR